MTTVQISRKLKASTLTETLTIRLHRAISWLKSAEKQDDNLEGSFSINLEEVNISLFL